MLLRWMYFRRYVARALGNRFPVARALVGQSRREYRAITKLLFIVPLYVVTIWVLATLILFIYVTANADAHKILIENGVNPLWFSAFHAVSAFCNSGLSIMPGNLVPFNRALVVLLVLSFTIIAGNVGKMGLPRIANLESVLTYILLARVSHFSSSYCSSIRKVCKTLTAEAIFVPVTTPAALLYSFVQLSSSTSPELQFAASCY